MKKIFVSVILLSSLKGLGQDSLKLKQIDSIVQAINRSELTVTSDSIIQDKPDLGLQMKTFVSSYFLGGDLKKYGDKNNIITQEKGDSKVINTSSTFYFDNNKLIKVEETGSNSKKDNMREMKMDWYYSDDKPLYYTLQTDKAEARAFLLLSMAKSIQSVLLEKK